MALPLDQFVRRLAESGLFTEAEVQAFVESLPASNKPADGEQLARLLVKQKKLTAYQAQEIYKGQGRNLVLGNYVILDKLGQGGMGLVLKAEHKRMKRIVAVKVLSPAALKSPEAVARFHREVEAAARLEHPNIVAAHDADEAHGTHFLVMQYVEGSDLASLVKHGGPLPVERALHCIMQAGKGLEFAHQEGVIHRDIKPANLLLDNKGMVKVLDMGLARFEASVAGSGAPELTGTGQIMGTVDYMAPEQALNTKHADQRADIYSLGISLWYLLTGRTAYDGETLMERIMAHQTQPIPSLRSACPGVSPELDSVFRKMVAKLPAERYQNMTEVLADLARCASSAGAAAPSVTVLPGEDSRLSEFLGANPAATASGGAPSPVVQAIDQAALTLAPEATLSVKAQTEDTDPKSNVSLPESVGHALRGVPAVGVPSVTVTPAGRKPAKSKPSRAPVGLIIAGIVATGLLVLLLPLGIWLFTRDGRVAKIEVPEGGSATIGAAEDETDLLDPSATAAMPNAESMFKNTLGMEFALIPRGKCWVGESSGRFGIREVEFKRDFYLGVHEVTQAEWKKLMPENRSYFSRTGQGRAAVKDLTDDILQQFPVEGGSGEDYQLFITRLNDACPEPGWTYRLPTGLEWEYACRGGPLNHGMGKEGAGFDFYFRRPVKGLPPRLANFGKHMNRTCKVGSFPPNQLGLYDMHGNVWELCTGPLQLMHMGGCWDNEASDCRATSRSPGAPSHGNYAFGLRVARVPTEEASAPASTGKYALEFDGKDDFVELPSLHYEEGHSVTIEALVTPTHTREEPAAVVQLCGPGWMSLVTREDGWGAVIHGPKASHARYGSGVLSPGRTDHVAVVGDLKKEMLRVYVNGQSTGTMLPPLKLKRVASPVSAIGAGYAETGLASRSRFFWGRIRGVRISKSARYDKPFTPPAEFEKDANTWALYQFKEGQGTELKDSSGNDHHGKIIGAKWVLTDGKEIPSTTPPAGNFALRFAGNGEMLRNDDLLIPARGSWTVEGWFAPREPLPTNGENCLLFFIDPPWFSIKHEGSKGVKWTIGGPVFKPPVTLATSASVVPNERVHVAYSRGPGGLSFFVNGVSPGPPLAIAFNGKETPLRICRLLKVNRDVPYHGDIDEIRISSVARYSENFTPKPRFEPDDQTLALYHFDEGQGDTVKDASKHGRHLKFVGAEWVKVADPADK